MGSINQSINQSTFIHHEFICFAAPELDNEQAKS